MNVNRKMLVVLAIAVILILLVALGSALGLHLINNTQTVSSASNDACSNPTPSPYITEYCVINRFSNPNAIAVDSQGNVWFIIQNESDLGVLYASNSTIGTFHIPSPNKLGVMSWGIAVDSSRNLVWFTDYVGNYIWSFNITSRHFSYTNVTSSSGAFPCDLVLDSQGNVWFTELYANALGEITTTGQQFSYSLPSNLTSVSDSGPFGLTTGRNGTLWFSDPVADSIGSFNPSTRSFDTYNLTGLATSPVGIAVDSQGNVWVTQHGPSLISEFNPQTKYFRSITTRVPPVLLDSLPYFVYIDSQGNIWFNEHYGNAISRFSPENNSLVEYVIPTRVAFGGNISGAITMALSPSGTPWFTEWWAGKVGKVNLGSPVNIGFSFQNSSMDNETLLLGTGSNLTLALNVSSPSNESVEMSLFLSTYNFLPPEVLSSSSSYNQTVPAFVYSYSTPSGEGEFASELTISDQGLSPGTYYLTVSEIATNVVFSRVLQIDVVG